MSRPILEAVRILSLAELDNDQRERRKDELRTLIQSEIGHRSRAEWESIIVANIPS